MTDETCETCRYVSDGYTILGDTVRRCRRYPPQFSGGKWGDIFSAPIVSSGGWCGEWAARSEQAEDEE